MRTQIIVEGIKYVSGNNALINQCFELCHITNNTDRNWVAKPHLELYYLDAFKKPMFLMIVDKQLHVYIIGEKDKGQTYNIINIEGFSSTHMVMTKGELRTLIYKTSKEEGDLFLPRGTVQRIICIKPDYDLSLLDDRTIFIFNRLGNGALFNKSKWTLGADIYSVDANEYETSAYEILKAILGEI